MSEDHDDAPSIDEAQDALQNVDQLREEAFAGVEASADVLDTATGDVGHANELLEDAAASVEEALEVVEGLNGGGRRGSSVDLHAALSELEEPHDILGNEMDRFLADLFDALEAAADGERKSAGALTIDGQVYQIELTPIGLDLPQSFNEWLRRKVEHNVGLDAPTIDMETSLDIERVDAIIDDSIANNEEAREIIEYLHDEWGVTSDERTHALSRYVEGGGDANLAALFEESE